MAPSIDEFEDLTQFADESFDTGEVDLFEFADDDDSPLLRLKSIVLSLDWDITEEILTELNEELASLRAMWKDDKVAQIYLQGMENVGRYMQAEGAYAHPNAIKLLLTLYHNYEKIISSPNISGENITAMLKADIRKFKVLQYQISSLKNAQSGGREEPAAAEAEKPRSPAKPVAAAPPSSSAAAPAAQDSSVPGPLRSMEATILGLEWEVTDEGLEKFSKESAELRSHLSGDKEAQVLIQGLQALGAYIREQKTNAHPDSFTILHSFYDALKMLLESPQLGAEQRRHILLEQIGSLNSLKEVIARAAAGRHEAAEPEEPEPEPQEAPAADDAAFSFNDEDDAVPAADAPTRPAASAKPAASGDEDEEFGDDLFSSDGGVVPALADEEEEGGFSDSLSTADLGADRATELDEKLDSFFNFDDELDEASPPAAGSKSAVASAKSSLARVLDDTPEDEDDDSADLDSSFFNFEDEFDEAPAAAADKGSGAALNFADDDSDSLFGGETEEDASPAAQPAAELEPGQSLSAAEQGDEDEEDDELDSFFNFDDELDVSPPPAKAKIVSAAAPAAAAEDEDVSLFGDEEEDGPVAALADEKEIPSAAKEEDELGSDFDSFFSFDDEEAAPLAGTEEEPAAAEEPDEVLNMDVGLFGGEDDESPAAVPDEADEEIPAAEAEAEADMLDSGSLASFFSFDDEEAAAPLAAEAEKEPAAAEEPDEVLSMDVGLFGGEDDESPAAVPDEADEEIPAAEAEAGADMLDSGSLDSFFSFDDEEAAAPLAAEEEEEPAAAEEPYEVLNMDVGLFGGEDDESPAAASDEADEEIGSEKAAEIKSKLDSLFSFEDDSLNNDLVEDSQDDTPDLDDDLITPLDDEPSAKIADENLFGADEFNDSSSPAAEEEEPVADSLTADDDDVLFGFDSGLDDGGGAAEAGEEPDFSAIGEDEDEAPAAEEAFFSIAGDENREPEAVVADRLTADDDDALFGFDSGLDDDSDAAEAGEEPDFSASGEDKDEAPAAEETEEAFFSIAGDEDRDSLSAAAEEEPKAQDEPFGLAEEESEAAEADSLTAADEDDALFGFDSGLDGGGAAEAGEEPDFSAIGEDEDEAPAAEETEEAFFSIAGDEDGDSLSAAAEEVEPEAQDELFGLAEEEAEAAEADSLTADEDDALFSSDSGAAVEPAAGKTEEEADELTAAALPDDNEDDLLLGKEYEAESQSAFFGQDDLPDPFASGVEPEPAEDEEEAAAGLSGKGAVAGSAAFASLAAAAAALSAVPSSAQLRQVAELASTARREEPLSVPQSIIMNLLDSSAALLAQAPEGEATGGGAVMQELTAALKRAEEPEALAGAVSRYTAWQQDFFAALLRRRPQLPEEAAAEDSLGLVREEFSRLKQELLTEFSQLRKEMMTLRN